MACDMTVNHQNMAWLWNRQTDRTQQVGFPAKVTIYKCCCTRHWQELRWTPVLRTNLLAPQQQSIMASMIRELENLCSTWRNQENWLVSAIPLRPREDIFVF